MLSACAATANHQRTPAPTKQPETIAAVTTGSNAAQPPSTVPPVCPVLEPEVCEPKSDPVADAAIRKLILGNEWHKERRYGAALEAYESVLVEHASLLVDAYALWGIIALRLDRDNPDYDRENAQTVAYVLDQRAREALSNEGAAEARLLWFSAQTMLTADVSKDAVVQENRNLRKELAEREEAIQRLRELTVGR